MPLREEDALSAAITETEKEIAGSAWGKEDEIVLDESGDRTVEEMGEGLEGQHEPDDDEESTEGEESEGDEKSGEGQDKGEEKDGEGETVQAAKPEPAKPEGRVPPGRLREQTKRAETAETKAADLEKQLETERTNSRKEIEALNAKFDGLLAAIQQRSGAPKADATAADTSKTATPIWERMFEDPKAFVEDMKKDVNTQVQSIGDQVNGMRVEFSMQLAHTRHGDSFTKAFEEISKLNPNDPDARALVGRIYTSPNPGEALVGWYKRNETLRRVGDDPDKFEKDVEARARESLMKDPEFRKQLLAELRAEASGADDGKPRNLVKLPPNLNGSAGGRTPRGVDDNLIYDDTDRAVADSAWR